MQASDDWYRGNVNYNTSTETIVSYIDLFNQRNHI